MIKMEESNYDFVNPKHYKKYPMEVIDMMVEIWGADKVISHCELCAFKYRMRAGSKPGQPIERDMDKVKWYEAKAEELKRRLKNK
jgi:hypothetical protein